MARWRWARMLAPAVLLALLAPQIMDFGDRAGRRENSGLHLAPHAAGRLPDLVGVRPVKLRKERFFRFLLPLVRQENRRLAAVRTRLGYIQDKIRLGQDIPAEDRQWLETTRKRFKIDLEDPGHPGFWEVLLERVDVIPEDLVLIQAANESAWGTSRFAREGNNLFGQWCFRPGCGLVPEGRAEGDTHEVARFPSITASVKAYLRNLNTGHAYEELRRIRARLRAEGKRPRAEDLARGLGRYSERGQDYVDDLRSMLRTNRPIIEKIRSTGAREGEA